MKSNPHSHTLFSAGRTLTKRLGIHRPARVLFNKLFLSRRTEEARLGNLTCRFYTPTLTLAEYVGTFTGEKDILLHLLQNLNPGDVVWDVGAAFGMYSLFASGKVGTTGRVFAFEPEPTMHRLLARNINLNSATNITVIPLALGGSASETELFASDSPNVGTSALIHRPDFRLKRRGTPVVMSTGDMLVDQGRVDPPTVVKIDTEGAEGMILDGMPATLANNSLRRLYIEIHRNLLPLFGSSATTVEQRITSAGFRIVQRQTRGREYHLVCEKAGS